MRFFFDPQAGEAQLKIEGEGYRHLFKARRHRQGETIALRNLADHFLYWYRIEYIDRREALLEKVGSEESIVVPSRFFHLAWCMIDPKTIEKSLPILNEIGVGKVSFIYCDRSQKNFKPNLKKWRKIVIGSCQQCGRSMPMQIEVVESLKKLLEKSDDNSWVMVDFCDRLLRSEKKVGSVLVGPEGGWSNEERILVGEDRRWGIDTPHILRSESAAVVVAALQMMG